MPFELNFNNYIELVTNRTDWARKTANMKVKYVVNPIASTTHQIRT